MSLKQLTGQIAACDEMRVRRDRTWSRRFNLDVLLKFGKHHQEWSVTEDDNGWLDATLILDTSLGEKARG